MVTVDENIFTFLIVTHTPIRESICLVIMIIFKGECILHPNIWHLKHIYTSQSKNRETNKQAIIGFDDIYKFQNRMRYKFKFVSTN